MDSRFSGLLLALLLPCAATGCAPADGPADALATDASAPLPAQVQPPGGADGQSTVVDDQRRGAIALAAERVAPAVVTISVIRTARDRPRSPMDFYFGPRGPQQLPGFGSGFVIDGRRGIVLTNEHVVRAAERIMVTLSDGRDLEAGLVGADEVLDVAVLRVEADDLPEAPIGTSDDLIIGEWAIAIGNPFGAMISNTEPTVTAGVVSAVGRHIVPNGEEQGFYLGMIQTDASINPGNSGGPLVNALGRVIGVNSSIFSRSGGSEGLGFAIPIDRALRAAEDLLEHGEVRRAWLGMDVEPVEADVWGRTRGVRVSRVFPSSPASSAGMEVGQRLLEAGGRRLTTPLDYEDVLLDLRAGDAVAIRVEGRGTGVTIRAEALPSSRAERVSALDDLDVITVTPEVQAERGLVSGAGALVVSTSPGLEQAGFRAGDVIVGINNRPVRSAEELAAFFRGLRGRGRIVVLIERDGGYLTRPLYWSSGA